MNHPREGGAYFMDDNTGITGASPAIRPLYTSEERARRDNTRWTLVQGVLDGLRAFRDIAWERESVRNDFSRIPE